MGVLRVGVSQLRVNEGKMEENKLHIEEVISEHSGSGVDLLCFPELCISGYDYEAAKNSEGEKEFFAEMAAKYRVPLLAGVSTCEDGLYYDVACIWDETGTLLGQYRKIHLWDTENEFFTGADEVIIVPFKGFKIGMLICADLGFAELSTELALRGADLIIYPSAWSPNWEELFISCGRMRAAENQAYVIALNRAKGSTGYCGNSTVCSPEGNVLLKLGTYDEAYGEVSIDQDEIKKARQNIPWLSMRRPEVYRKLKEEK